MAQLMEETCPINAHLCSPEEETSLSKLFVSGWGKHGQCNVGKLKRGTFFLSLKADVIPFSCACIQYETPEYIKEEKNQLRS